MREVDDELRRDQAMGLWRRWGRIAIVAIVVGLIAFGGWLFWRNQQYEARGVEGEQMAQSLQKLEANDVTGATALLTPLAASKTNGYRATAQLALAATALDKGDVDGAAKRYAAIAADTSLDQPFRDLAIIRQTAAEYDKLTPAQVVDRLRPLAVPGNSFFGSAGEMTGIAYMRMGKPKVAGTMFAAMAIDQGVPEAMRSRAVQLAAANGVDATQAPRAVVQ
ncbi:tetratricopeptide repeat protein [Sphingomonas antarctica]|uniref:tetratricopeptide repeat protein n=1 Tax=Sphingomonas antarctica TaxID=2040274 RepID=UPI0039E950B3